MSTLTAFNTDTQISNFSKLANNTKKWLNQDQQGPQTFDVVPSSQLATLILPQLRATEISPRFQNSVGKTLKDH